MIKKKKKKKDSILGPFAFHHMHKYEKTVTECTERNFCRSYITLVIMKCLNLAAGTMNHDWDLIESLER